ncbi:hypothetical protein EMCRGX_G004031 [Ephydatia muelleri]
MADLLAELEEHWKVLVNNATPWSRGAVRILVKDCVTSSDRSFAQKGSGGNLVTGCTHQAKSGTKVALACLGCDQTCHYHDAVMGLTWLVRVEARRVPPAIDV